LLTKRSFTMPAAALMLAATLTTGFAQKTRAQDVPLPESAITEDTAVAIWVDVNQLNVDSLRAAVDSVNAALPAQMRATEQQIDAKFESEQDQQEAFQAFREAGGQGMLMLMRTPEGDGPPPEPVTLVRVEEGTNAADITAIAKQLDQFNPDSEPVDYKPGWIVEKDAKANIPTTGTAEQAQVMQQLLAKTESSPVRIAFRMTPALRQKLAEQAQGAQGGQGGQAGQGGMSQLGPAAALVGPAQGIDAGWGTLNLGDNPAYTQMIQFKDAQSAQQFKGAWEGLLMMGQGLLQQQLSQLPNAPEPQAVQGLFNSLKTEQQDNTLKLHLGGQFIQSAAQLAPAAQSMFMMSMGARPAPRGGQQTQPRHEPARPAPQQ